MTKFTSLLLVLLYISCATSSSKPQVEEKYIANWESLQKYQIPEWYRDAKFGIYFHWGPYSVPAHKTEWYSTLMYRDGHPIRQYHEEKYGPLDQFGYKDFIPLFTAEHFNAEEWADLFVAAGAQFAGPVAEHADGFAMWDSELTPWNAADLGPRRDIVGDMENAIKQRGLKYIITYHRHWLYAWYPTWNQGVDAGNQKYAELYGPYAPEGSFVMATGKYPTQPDQAFQEDWLARLDELMRKYEPDIIWFDNKMDIIDETFRQRFLANYYNNAVDWNKEVVCTYKFKDLPAGTAVLDLERSRMSDKKDFTWLTDDSIDWEAWCHINSPRYKSVNRLVDFLVDVVSKNGAVLLNITPRADGIIPKAVKDRLLGIGRWLEINGEAIYGTRTWYTYGEGPQKITEGHLSEDQNPEAGAEDVRFTTKENNLYAIVLDWPKDTLIIKSLTPMALKDKLIAKVNLLGHESPLVWELTERGLAVRFPEIRPCDHAYSLKVTFAQS